MVHDQPHAAVLHLRLSPGLRAGDHVRLVGAGHHHPDAAAGDLVVELAEAQGDGDEDIIRPSHWRVTSSDAAMHGLPESATRPRSDDLVAFVDVSLHEALLGWERELAHPSGRAVVVRSPPGQTTSPGECIVVPGAGMPRRVHSIWRSVTLVAQDSNSIMELQDSDRNRAVAASDNERDGSKSGGAWDTVERVVDWVVSRENGVLRQLGGLLPHVVAPVVAALTDEPRGDLLVIVRVVLPTDPLSSEGKRLLSTAFPAEQLCGRGGRCTPNVELAGSADSATSEDSAASGSEPVDSEGDSDGSGTYDASGRRAKQGWRDPGATALD